MAQNAVAETTAAASAVVPNTVEQAFDSMQKAGLNTTDNLVSWMKQSHLVDVTKEAEERAKGLFDGVDPKHVPLDKFKEVVQGLGKEQNLNQADITAALTNTVNTTLQQLQGGCLDGGGSKLFGNVLQRGQQRVERCCKVM